MDWIAIVVALAVGAVLGFAAAWITRIAQGKSAEELAAKLFAENEQRRSDSQNAMMDQLRASFGDLSLQALSRSTEEFLKLAGERLSLERESSSKELTEKKGLIDQQLVRMGKGLDDVSQLMQQLEKDREAKYGALEQQLKQAGEQTAKLASTTSALKEALASSQARGQWGERMAEDVLRIAGMKEGYNYVKQQTLGESRTRPDFTFMLPKDLRLNMDVKFPLANYMQYLEADTDMERASHRDVFLKDVRQRIKEIVGRDYINPGQHTVDYVLLFIPNDQVFAFINEQERTILDDALRQKVILCSPVTLFAVLAVIRQAVDNFAIEKASDQMLSILGEFKKQWEKYNSKVEELGKRLNSAHKSFEDLSGTRTRMLERQMNKLDDIRASRDIPLLEED